MFDYYAGAPERLLGSQIPVSGGVDVTFREPLGVVGLITPWNFPLPIASWKVGPALAAGNTIVLKPAELTPLTAIELGKLALEAGIPEGVLNVLNGPGRTVGERIVEHPDVAKVAFTGSTEIGRRVGEIASQSIKRVTLELGGKSANVVFADADLEKAAAAAPLAVFGNAGQDCCARSRILVERSAVEPFLEALEREVKSLRVGDPLDDATQMGPLISADHREKVASYVDDGAPVAFRGSAPDGPGFWFPPTGLRRSRTTIAPRAKRSSGRSSRSFPSTTRQTRSASRTTRSTASPARSGRVTEPAPSGSRGRSRPATSRSTRTIQSV